MKKELAGAQKLKVFASVTGLLKEKIVEHVQRVI